jgi:polysaccharide chain length determinant protein (PEP-CTERM system associated)
MPLRPDMELQDYVKIFIKRKRVIIFSFLFVFLGASVYIVITPKQYKSTTTILITPQKVPEEFVRSTITVGAEDRLPIIEAQVKSRPRVKKVMEELGLYAEARKEGLEDEAVGSMISRIEVGVAQESSIGGKPQTESDVFSISFLNEDPMLSMLTASRLASLFIEENMKLREKQAVGTSEFLETQLKETKAKLDVQEERVKQYKMRFSGGLPEELSTNLSNLSRLQQRESMIADEIRGLRNGRVMLQTQISMLERGSHAVFRDDGKVEVDTSEDSAAAITKDLNEKRNLLTALSAKYTDRYPDVVRLRGEVEELERKLEEIPLAARSSGEIGPGGQGKNVKDAGTYLPLTGREMEEARLLKTQMSSMDVDIKALNRERESVARKIAAVQAEVDRAPRRGQELITLTRDYENLKKLYNDLQAKKTEADIAQDLEMRMKGAQFQILDPAILPKSPFKPNIRKILALAFLFAGFLGFGGAIGLETIDLSLRGVTDFKHFFDLPILARIPILETVEFDRRQKFRKKAIIGGILSFAFVVVAFVLFFITK